MLLAFVCLFCFIDGLPSERGGLSGLLDVHPDRTPIGSVFESVLTLVKTEWCGADIVICLERNADLHMVQLMPLLLTISCFYRIQTDFTVFSLFWYWLTRVVPDKEPLNSCCCLVWEILRKKIKHQQQTDLLISLVSSCSDFNLGKLSHFSTVLCIYKCNFIISYDM